MSDTSEALTPDQHNAAAALEALVPEELRGFIAIDAVPLSEPVLRDVSRAFREAIEAITPACRVRRRFYICFARSPFTLKMPNSELQLTFKPGVLHMHVEDMIFIDIPNLLSVRHEWRVACILEELCHAMMSISDEDLVGKVVSYLYPGITWQEGEYVLPEPVVTTA